MGDVADFAADTFDDVFGTDIGPQNQEDLQRAEARRAAKKQAEYEQRAKEARTKEQSEWNAFVEAQQRDSKRQSIRDSSLEKKKKLQSMRKQDAAVIASQKMSEKGENITSAAAQRGGTGGLRTGDTARGQSTRQDYSKWRKKQGGLTLGIGRYGQGPRPS